MPYGPPLTRAQLRDIGERKDPSDITLLLWEIKRLRSIVLRADHAVRTVGPMGGSAGMIVGALASELKGEPCIEEFKALRLDER